MGYVFMDQSNEDIIKGQIYISPEFLGGLTASDLLLTSGTITFEMSRDNMRRLDIVLFDLNTDDFRFRMAIRNGAILLERGKDRAIIYPYLENNAEKRRVFAIWDPSMLMIRCGTSKDDEVVQVTETTIIFPPTSLIRLARYQNLIPTNVFPNTEAFRNSVYELLVKFQDDIEHLGTYSPFWDESYEGRKKGTPTPKRETDIHPTLDLLFADWALLHSVEVIRENLTGVGSLDFCFVGFVSDVGRVPLCVEVKKAHAKDIVHGLEVQLPLYMESKRAQYGAYLVFWFKGDWFDKPTLTDIQNISSAWIEDSDKLPTQANLENLEFALNGITLSNPKLQNIRAFIIDASKPIMASKA